MLLEVPTVLFVSDAAQANDAELPSWARSLGLKQQDYAVAYAAKQSINGEAPSFDEIAAKKPLLLAAIRNHRPHVLIALGHTAKSALVLAGERRFLFIKHPAWYARVNKSPGADLSILAAQLEDRLTLPRVEPCAQCRNDSTFGSLHNGCRDCRRFPV